VCVVVLVLPFYDTCERTRIRGLLPPLFEPTPEGRF
jgi:hypothetical protein